MARLSFTRRQRLMVTMMLNEADKGRYITMKEVHTALMPDASEQAALCAINFLVKKGVVEKVYGPDYGPYRPHTLLHLKPTALSYWVFRPGFLSDLEAKI